MKWLTQILCLAALLASCQTAEEAFIGNRSHTLCDDAYWLCNYPTGCVLDGDQYVKGNFPGDRRVVIDTEYEDSVITVRLFFSEMKSPGTELLIQAYETDCSLDTNLARAHLVDKDIFDEAGDNRTLEYDLEITQEGEHLLEIYSDSSAEYVLVVTTD